MTRPLMPKATAAWLIDHTTLTFEQIAAFVGLHQLEVQKIADEESDGGIIGLDPVTNGQLTHDEIARCEKDPLASLTILETDLPAPLVKSKGARYTPIAKRADKPDAIAWLVKNQPAMSDAQISKLIGTTKQTIDAVRTRSHWNSANINPRHPVELGMCSRDELDQMIRKAREKAEHKAKRLAEKTPGEIQDVQVQDTAVQDFSSYKPEPGGQENPE